MDKTVFERNISYLAECEPSLCQRLRSAVQSSAAGQRYRFSEARNGEPVPAIIDSSGAAHALHSTVDPHREAERLMASQYADSGQYQAGFLVFLGLGGAYAAEAALHSADITGIVIIDHDIHGIAELLGAMDYTKIFSDPRCSVLIDPLPGEIELFITGHYQPAVCGGIKVIPLRSRTAHAPELFNADAAAIERSIKKISADYSVQAHFGMRWFSNIIRNLKAAETINKRLTRDSGGFMNGRRISEAAVCAAGPSLDTQIPLLIERKHKNRELFIIAADTSFPALLCRGLRPDAVVSIDCQHISYYHFVGTQCRDIPLFLDIASPPLLAGMSDMPLFYSGGHPLSQYISRNWLPLNLLDTSGGTVTYACLSLAGDLGAKDIRVYGADFSYPQGKVYAKGTYIFPFFEKKQQRLKPLEALLSAFMYRTPFLEPDGNTNYRETSTLRFYRERCAEKAKALYASVYFEPGSGPLMEPHIAAASLQAEIPPKPYAHNANPGASLFLETYKTSVEKLPIPGNNTAAYMQKLNSAETEILLTLLPLAAALKHRKPSLSTSELMEAAKLYCMQEIEQVTSNK